jgi:hypothetical protein
MYLYIYFLTMYMYIVCINFMFPGINVSLKLAIFLQSMWVTLWIDNLWFYIKCVGIRSGAVGWRHFVTSRKVAGSITDGSMRFIINIIPPAALWPWDRLSLSQKWVPAVFPARQMQPVRTADNLTTFTYRLSRNSGSLNLLQPSGPVQACRGIALLLYKSFTFIGLYLGEYTCFCLNTLSLVPKLWPSEH